MPCITDKTPLESGCFFHIYNRGINKEKLFYYNTHYQIFLNNYKILLGDYVETYAYCLLPNHFHFMFRINDSDYTGYESIISTHLNVLFSQHALMINKEINRYGSLFCKSFKRIKIRSDFYLQNLVSYIHRNPVKHRLTNDYQTYQYSSFNEIIQNKSDIIAIPDVITIFGSFNEFIRHHQEYSPYALLGKLSIENQQKND